MGQHLLISNVNLGFTGTAADALARLDSKPSCTVTKVSLESGSNQAQIRAVGPLQAEHRLDGKLQRHTTYCSFHSLVDLGLTIL